METHSPFFTLSSSFQSLYRHSLHILIVGIGESGLLSQHVAEYFDRYFGWYNTEHFHSSIDYVTPEQCHQGLREIIVAQRKELLESHRQLRKEVNRKRQTVLTDGKKPLIIIFDQPSACSVIDL